MVESYSAGRGGNLCYARLLHLVANAGPDVGDVLDQEAQSSIRTGQRQEDVSAFCLVLSFPSMV